MLLKLIRWARGYVEFFVSGGFPERFINLLNHRGIIYWDFVPSKDGFTGTMTVRDYRNIRQIARKSGVRLRVRKKNGLLFQIRKYKRRKGLLAGVLAAITLIAFLNQFVWTIELNGASAINELELRAALSENGLDIGSPKADLNTGEIKRGLQLRIPGISWSSVNLIESDAEVELKEGVTVKKKKNSDKPANIKAACDGVITKTNVRRGVLSVKKGSAVTRNQLLVSSVTQDSDGKINFVRSKAEIFADVIEKDEINIPNSNYNIIPDENYYEKSRLEFLTLSLPLRMSDESGEGVRNYYTYKLCVNSRLLPLGESIERVYPLKAVRQKLNPALRRESLKNRMGLNECFNHGDCKIKTRQKAFKNDRLEVNYTLNKNIAVIQPIEVR